MKVFIGGSKNQTKLTERAKNQIEAFLSDDCYILIGDCYGIDLSVQRLLAERGYKQVTVYCSGDVPRNNVGGWSVVTLHSDKRGYEFYRQKDIAMSADCDSGFMIWDGKSKGTKQNIADLERLGKPVHVEPCGSCKPSLSSFSKS